MSKIKKAVVGVSIITAIGISIPFAHEIGHVLITLLTSGVVESVSYTRVDVSDCLDVCFKYNALWDGVFE